MSFILGLIFGAVAGVIVAALMLRLGQQALIYKVLCDTRLIIQRANTAPKYAFFAPVCAVAFSDFATAVADVNGAKVH